MTKRVTALNTPPAQGEPSSPGRWQSAFDSRFPLRLLVAVAGSALICLAVWLARPTHLSGHIDIVGYPTFTNYNYLPMFLGYRLITYAFPVGVIVIYALLDWRGPLRRTTKESRAEPVPLVTETAEPPATPTRGHTAWLGLWLRLIPPAIVVAIAVGPRTAQTLSDAVALRVASAVAYVVAVAAVSWLGTTAARRYLGSGPWSFDRCLLVVNAGAAAVAAFGGLWLASHNTLVVLTDGSVHHWPWIPWWLAGSGIIAAWAWMAYRLRRGCSPRLVEQRMRTVLIGSAIVYLIVAAIPGAISQFQGFDDAQNLTAAALLQRGYFPWRDFEFIHGLFADVLEPLLGFHIFGATEWGASAAVDLIFAPLSWVGMYLLGLWAARRGALIVLGTLALAASGVVGLDPRFIAIPLVLVLLGKAIASPRLAWTAALTVALFIQGVVVPEADYLVIAAFLVVLGADVVHRRRGQRLVVTLRHTLCFVGTGAVLTGAWAVFLASQHALIAYVDWFVVFLPGHNAEGDVHPYLGSTFLDTMFGLMMGLAVATFLTSAWRVLHRRAWTPVAWVTLAAALNAAVYGEQAIARFDVGHIALSVEMGLPLIILWIAAAVPPIDDLLARQLDRAGHVPDHLGWRPQPLALTGMVVAIVAVPAMRQTIWHVPQRTRVQVGVQSTGSRLGYVTPGVPPPALLSDFRTVLDTYAPKNAPFFDMSNSPGYFYYLLTQRPATRFTNVSLAIPEPAQRLLIDDLRKSRPPLVAFNSYDTGFASWDGILPAIRHFLVGQYVLDHWTPLLVAGGVLFLLRNDLVSTRPPVPHLTTPPVTSDLYNSQGPCNWGDAADFLDSPAVGRSITVVAQRSQQVPLLTVTGWAFDKTAGKPAKEIVAAIGRKAVGVMPVGGIRTDVAEAVGPSALASGFDSTFASRISPDMHLYALTSDGALHPLPGLGSPRVLPATIQMPDGSVLRVGAAGFGSVNSIVPSIKRLTTFRLPMSASLSSYRLATFGADGPIGTSQLTFSDVGVKPASMPTGATITAGTLPVTGSRLAVRVGSCLQWHGYRGRALYLIQTGGAPITSLTLSGVGQ